MKLLDAYKKNDKHISSTKSLTSSQTLEPSATFGKKTPFRRIGWRMCNPPRRVVVNLHPLLVTRRENLGESLGCGMVRSSYQHRLAYWSNTHDFCSRSGFCWPNFSFPNFWDVGVWWKLIQCPGNPQLASGTGPGSLAHALGRAPCQRVGSDFGASSWGSVDSTCAPRWDVLKMCWYSSEMGRKKSLAQTLDRWFKAQTWEHDYQVLKYRPVVLFGTCVLSLGRWQIMAVIGEYHDFIDTTQTRDLKMFSVIKIHMCFMFFQTSQQTTLLFRHGFWSISTRFPTLPHRSPKKNQVASMPTKPCGAAVRPSASGRNWSAGCCVWSCGRHSKAPRRCWNETWCVVGFWTRWLNSKMGCLMLFVEKRWKNYIKYYKIITRISGTNQSSGLRSPVLYKHYITLFLYSIG